MRVKAKFTSQILKTTGGPPSIIFVPNPLTLSVTGNTS